MGGRSLFEDPTAAFLYRQKRRANTFLERWERTVNNMQAKEKVPAWPLFQAETGKSYGMDQLVYMQGEQADSFFYLKKGRVKIFLSSESGMEKTLTLLEPGNIFGEAAFFDGMPRMSSARTIQNSEIVRVTRGDLLGYFSREPELAMSLLTLLARTVRMLSDQVDHMTFLQADKRIALQLLKMQGECGREGKRIACTHEDLGNLAGASRVTVSKILNRCARAGWISTHYRSVVIVDQEALRAFAQEG